MSQSIPPEQREDCWPADTSFPLNDKECSSLIRGEWVRWPGTLAQFRDMPARYEMIGDWICLKR